MRREESRFELVYRLTSCLRVSRLTSRAPIPRSPFYIFHFPFSISRSPFPCLRVRAWLRSGQQERYVVSPDDVARPGVRELAAFSA